MDSKESHRRALGIISPELGFLSKGIIPFSGPLVEGIIPTTASSGLVSRGAFFSVRIEIQICIQVFECGGRAEVVVNLISLRCYRHDRSSDATQHLHTEPRKNAQICRPLARIGSSATALANLQTVIYVGNPFCIGGIATTSCQIMTESVSTPVMVSS